MVTVQCANDADVAVILADDDDDDEDDVAIVVQAIGIFLITALVAGVLVSVVVLVVVFGDLLSQSCWTYS